MVDSIKITALQDIGANIAYTTLVPLVNMAGTPTTQKSNLQNLGNLILNGAGGSYFPRAAQANLALSVANAAQPNITSVGTLASLAVTGNITAGNINGGNIMVANFYYGDGGFLTNVAGGGTNYSNSNVAAYLPTYTGNVGAGNVNVTGTVYASGLSSTGLASLTVLNVSATANLGAVGNVRITGGTSGQKLTTDGAGNLSWTNDANSSYGNSNVAAYLPTYTGNVGAGNIKSTGNLGVTANTLTWNFTNEGVLQWPGGIGQIDTNNSTFEIHSTNGLIISTNEANSSQSFLFGTDGTVYCPANATFEGTRLNVGPGSSNASLTNPTLVVTDTGGEFIQTAILNQNPNGSSDYAAYGADSNETQGFTDLGFAGHNFNDPNYTITLPGDGYVLAQGYANGIGGGLIVATGDKGNVPDIIFATGGFMSNDEFARIDHANSLFHLTRANSGIQFSDGSIQTTAGGGGSTGNVTFDDVTVQGAGAQLFLSPDPTFTANLAYVRVRAGDVASHIHMDTGNNEAYDLILGDDSKFVQVSSTGNIIMSSYDGNASYTWTLDTTGNLTLPLGSVVYETNIPDGALSGSAIALKPIGGATANQQLLIYPTAADGDHIHLTSGNLYATELFLGSDDFYVKLANTGNVVINSNDGNSNTAMWTFGIDGTTTFPAGNITSDTSLQFTTTFANVKTVEYQTAGVWDLYVEDSITGSNAAASRLNVSFKDNLIDKPQVYIENTKESDGIALRWTFDENGNLNFPRDVAGNTDPYLTIVSGSNPSINAIDASLAGPANLGISALNTTFTGFSGDAIKIYPDDGEISSTANLQLWANSGGNTEYSWTFDTTGNLTTSSNLVIGPGPGSGSSILQYDDVLQIVGEGANSTVIMGWTANQSAPDSVATIAMNFPSGGEGNVLIAVGNNATTVNYWLFDNTGNLTTPGSILPGTANTFDIGNGSNYFRDAYFSGNVNTEAVQTSDGGLTHSGTAVGINANAGKDIYLYADAANVGWTFDSAGNLTLPGNTFAVNYANGTQVPVGVTQDITSNGNMSIMTYDGNLKYVNNATVEPSTGNITGGNLITTGIAKTGVFTTGTIPAATIGIGARAFVTDATANTFGTAYVGGAANAVPVWSDGTIWYIG